VHDDELRPDYIVPSVFDRGVAPAVAEAVRHAAASGSVRHGSGGSGGLKPSPPADRG